MRKARLAPPGADFEVQVVSAKTSRRKTPHEKPKTEVKEEQERHMPLRTFFFYMHTCTHIYINMFMPRVCTYIEITRAYT